MRGDWAWYNALFGFKGWLSKDICWRCKVNCSDIPWTVTSTAAARRTSRYRTSDLLARQTEQGISVNPLFSLPGFPAELICIDVLQSMDLGATQDATGILFFSIWPQARVGHALFSISCMCVCACLLVCLCVFVGVPRACPVVFSVPWRPGPFRAQSRSGRIAQPWNTIRLHYKTFHTQCRLQNLT